jgi:hypothetical protein
MLGGWPDILAEGRRGHGDREAQHYENESTSHSLSLADRGESRTDYAANRALSQGTGSLFRLWLENKNLLNALRLELTKRGCGPLVLRCAGDFRGCRADVSSKLSGTSNSRTLRPSLYILVHHFDSDVR